MDIEEAELAKLQEKAAGFDQIYDELYLEEETGQYTISKKQHSVELIHSISTIVNGIRDAPGASATDGE